MDHETTHRLELLRKSPDPPSLILLDLMMPEMDGWTFREIQKNEERLAHVPVLALSANARGRPIDVELMNKPVDLDRLLSAVKTYCSKAA